MSEPTPTPITRDRVRAMIVNAHRARRTTPREGIPAENPRAWEDPAPDWVWQTVDAILAYTTHERDFGLGLATRAISWCARGAPEERAAQIRKVIALWLGERAGMLHHFLTAAEQTNGGRRVPHKRTPAQLAEEAVAILHESTVAGTATGNRAHPEFVEKLRRVLHAIERRS